MIAERWGKKFVDNRDWPKYSEELVVRGEFLLDLKWVKSWDKENAFLFNLIKGGTWEAGTLLPRYHGISQPAPLPRNPWRLP